MVIIVHFSDIHCGNKDRTDKFRHLAKKVVGRFQTSECIVCITGDLIDDTLSDFNLEKIYGIMKEEFTDKGYKLLTIPGNHDYGSGSAFPKNVHENVRAYKELFFSGSGVTYNPSWDSDSFYPKKDILEYGNENIAFIGMDSNEGELNNFLSRKGADGRFGRKQLERLKRLLNDDVEIQESKYRIIYFHHNAYECVLPDLIIDEFHELHDREKLGEIITEYNTKNPDSPVNALLYGHEHLFRKEIPGLWGVPRCYDAGSSTGKETTGIKKKLFQILSIDKQPVKVRIIDLSKDQVEDVEEDWLADFWPGQ